MEQIDEATLKVRAGYRSSTWCFYIGVWMLMIIGITAPVAALALEWMPIGEKRTIWFQRSGAVTTLFSFLGAALAVVTSGRLYTPGSYGQLDKIEVLKEFKTQFIWAEIGLIVLSVLGTIIWGYGDLIVRQFLIYA